MVVVIMSNEARKMSRFGGDTEERERESGLELS